jgi:hypothetical protein
MQPTGPRGTEQSPIVVRVVPAAKSQAESYQDAADRKERTEAERKKAELDRQLVDYNGDLAHYTKVLAVIAVLQFLALLAQAIVIPSTVRESRRVGITAREAMIVSNRAYVNYGGCHWISHPALSDGHIYWQIHPMWTNSGNTPTRRLSVRVHYELRDTPLPVDFGFVVPEVDGAPATIAPKASIGSLPYPINGSDLVAIRDGTKHLYVWGVARYWDVFQGTPRYVTKFCVEASDITGDPLKAWHDVENRVGIVFRTYVRHNCADDECGQSA